MPRVAMNAPAPDFTLPDFSGKPVSISDFRGKKNVRLVFNRTVTLRDTWAKIEKGQKGA